MNSRRCPGQRAGLTHTDVIAGARKILDADGFDAVTMRAVASHLEVSPNALYSHVANKTALVDAILDDVLGEVVAPDHVTVDPRAGLHQIMVSTYEVLLDYPELVPAYLARQGARGSNAERLGAVMLALLERLDVTGAAANAALHVLIIYTIGSAAFRTSAAPLQGPDPAAQASQLADNFRSGLEWLLTGVMDTG